MHTVTGQIRQPGHLARHGLAVIAVLLVPALWINRVYGRGFWEVGGARVWVLLPIAAAYVIGSAFLWARLRRQGRVTLLTLIPSYLLSIAATAGLFFIPGINFSTAVVALALAGSLTLQWGLFAVAGYQRTKTALLVIVILAAALTHGAYGTGHFPRRQDAQAAEQTIGSNLYSILVQSIQRPVPMPIQSGGGLARLWDDYLLAVGDGSLYRFSAPDSGGQLPIRRLGLRVPTNPDAFRAAVSELDVRMDWFRVADIETILGDNELTIFATHHYWHRDRQCFTARVSRIVIARAEIESVIEDRPWTTLFETSPCLAVTLPTDGRPFFGGLQIGGRMAMLGNDTLLVTIGDHEFDGVTAPISLPQDTKASYGKIFAIHLSSGTSGMLSIGHRNPQGLFVTNDRTVWSTEHGPRGGDELNRIERGKNYGWPIVTYGVQYSEFAWPFNPRQGSHDGYEPPVFAWVPSIGVSSILEVSTPSFPAWRGDLLVGSLEAKTLWRLHLTDNRVVLTEPIQLGIQIRDMIEGHRGEIVIWNEQHPGPHLAFVTPSDGAGPAFFAQCSGCHDLGDGESHSIGPDLAGVVGQRVASRNGYLYSDALKRIGGTWTESRLDEFLRDPVHFAPGNNMRFPGLADSGRRRAIIEYLKSRRVAPHD